LAKRAITACVNFSLENISGITEEFRPREIMNRVAAKKCRAWRGISRGPADLVDHPHMLLPDGTVTGPSAAQTSLKPTERS
jgi:hypothetical protein